MFSCDTKVNDLSVWKIQIIEKGEAGLNHPIPYTCDHRPKSLEESLWRVTIKKFSQCIYTHIFFFPFLQCIHQNPQEDWWQEASLPEHRSDPFRKDDIQSFLKLRDRLAVQVSVGMLGKSFCTLVQYSLNSMFSLKYSFITSLKILYNQYDFYCCNKDHERKN